MIAIVHSIYSQSVHAPARDAGLMDNDAERYCMVADVPRHVSASASRIKYSIILCYYHTMLLSFIYVFICIY